MHKSDNVCCLVKNQLFHLFLGDVDIFKEHMCPTGAQRVTRREDWDHKMG